jgi:hypothetical protein
MGFVLMLLISGLNNLMRLYISNKCTCMYEFQNSPIPMGRSKDIKLMLQPMLSPFFQLGHRENADILS